MPRTVITPPGRLSLPRVPELWGARDVLVQFGKRDVLLRYRQTALGVIWVVIQPVVSAGIFSIVFGQVAKLPSDGVPYFLFSFAGMLAWNLFNGIVSRAAPSLVANQALVSKVYFPRLLVPLSSALSVLLDFVVAFVLFVVLLAVYGVNPGWPVLLVPVWALAAMAMASGLGLAAAAVTVKYRDVTYALPWVLQLLLYGTPIAWALSAAPAGLRWLFELNPLTWLVEAFRWSALGTAQPPLWQITGVVAAAAASLLLGTVVFGRYERGFADFI